jgi:hypothetical protein
MMIGHEHRRETILGRWNQWERRGGKERVFGGKRDRSNIYIYIYMRIA